MRIDLHGLLLFIGTSLIVIGFFWVHKVQKKDLESRLSSMDYCLHPELPCEKCPGFKKCERW